MLKRPFFERLFRRWGRRRVDRRAFQELGRSLALIVDREALKSSVAARIRELFDPNRLVVLEPDFGEAVFQPGFSFGFDLDALEGVEILARGKLARWLTVNEVCFVRDRQPGVFDYLDPAEKELFDRLQVTVVVPMVSLNRMTGILFLGWDRPGRLRASDLELLQLLASQASLAFENAALYRAQQERLDRLHRAERLAAVGQLAAGVAHEIRNPLTAIRSTMQYLLQGLDPSEPRHQLVAEILSEVDRINATVGGLLSLSRAGEIHLTETDLTELVSTSVHLVQARAGQQGVDLETRLGSEPLRVLADTGQLKQVFLNLLLNALQSMSDGGRITVTASPWRSPVGPGQRWAQIRIADTGSGISSEQLRHVFDPLYTTKREGTGLGLAICYGIVERHQGEIQLESEVGKGTTASVRLPLAEKKAWPTS